MSVGDQTRPPNEKIAAIGVKLPGLNFKNQRVEAAYRKELVFGEHHIVPLKAGDTLHWKVQRD